MLATFASILAQAATDAAGSAPATAADMERPWWSNLMFPLLLMGLVYFALIRPQSVAKKKQEELLKSIRTGDKIITTSGIHGVVSNVKDTTVIVKVADNVKLEIEKSHVDKLTRGEDDTKAVSKTTATAKA